MFAFLYITSLWQFVWYFLALSRLDKTVNNKNHNIKKLQTKYHHWRAMIMKYFTWFSLYFMVLAFPNWHHESISHNSHNLLKKVNFIWQAQVTAQEPEPTLLSLSYFGAQPSLSQLWFLCFWAEKGKCKCCQNIFHQKSEIIVMIF